MYWLEEEEEEEVVADPSHPNASLSWTSDRLHN